jgi:hypothetical protein
VPVTVHPASRYPHTQSHRLPLPRRSTLQLPSTSMTNSPDSQLRPSAQRTIDAINLPFRTLEQASTPLIAYLRSSNRLVRCICAQNWIFSCIFYLHIWQTFKSSPPIRPLARHWTCITCRILFGCCTTCAVLILRASVPLFGASWRNGRSGDSSSGMASIRVHHLALFVLTCAPACAVLGTAGAAVYYAFKRHRHGVYLARMRKQGRGYWADPRDFGDWRKWQSRQEAIDEL